MTDSTSQSAKTTSSTAVSKAVAGPIKRKKRDRSSGFAASTLAVPLQTAVRAKVDKLSRHTGLTPGEVVEVLATRALEEQLPVARMQDEDGGHTILEAVEALHRTHLQRLEQMSQSPIKQALPPGVLAASGAVKPAGA